MALVAKSAWLGVIISFCGYAPLIGTTNGIDFASSNLESLVPETLYKLEFTDEQWDELHALDQIDIELTESGELTREDWLTLRASVENKADYIASGNYGSQEEWEDVDLEEWVAELREIVKVISRKFPPQGLYTIEFNDDQWDELTALTGEIKVEPEQPMTRSQWTTLGHVALGKAVRVARGDYGTSDPNYEDDGVDTDEWAEQLEDIAAVIFNKFQPGDGQI